MDKDSEVINFEVILNEIPTLKVVGNRLVEEYQNQTNYMRGKDVMINWDFDQFNTGGDLWVDSNGLDMHNKQLWKRKEFTQEKTNNIASNFYPVTSALAIRDKNSNNQVTMMVDRSQAGSAGLRNGSNIELMQNRRINGYDGYGVTEALNDRDAEGRGYQIKASYRMQIFDRTKPSQQRSVQKSIEQPLVVHYSKDFKLHGKNLKSIKPNKGLA